MDEYVKLYIVGLPGDEIYGSLIPLKSAENMLGDILRIGYDFFSPEFLKFLNDTKDKNFGIDNVFVTDMDDNILYHMKDGEFVYGGEQEVPQLCGFNVEPQTYKSDSKLNPDWSDEPKDQHGIVRSGYHDGEKLKTLGPYSAPRGEVSEIIDVWEIGEDKKMEYVTFTPRLKRIADQEEKSNSLKKDWDFSHSIKSYLSGK